MKVLVVGGTGTIGKAIVTELSPRHTVIVAGHNNGDVQVDITDTISIEKMYAQVGKVDAVVSAAGSVHFDTLSNLKAEHFAIGLQSKLMGQINLVLLGFFYVNEGGSFTLTSGILNRDPIRFGSSAAMVNGALDGFVKCAALEMPKSIRINAVSPTVLKESMPKYEDYFRGFEPVTAARVALAYSKSVEGGQTGQVYEVNG